MKIRIVKKGSRVRVSEPCPYLLEVPPEAGK